MEMAHPGSYIENGNIEEEGNKSDRKLTAAKLSISIKTEAGAPIHS
jgi:hypothetical protein